MQENGYLLPAIEAPNHSSTRSGQERGSGKKAKPANRVRLNGNIVRRKTGNHLREYWDIDLPGFGLRVNLGGRQTWFVLFRQRAKLSRVSLGSSRDSPPPREGETGQSGAGRSANAQEGSRCDEGRRAPAARLRRMLLG